MSVVDDGGLERFATVRLTSDLRGLTVRERAMIPILIDAAKRMDNIYWLEMFGPRESELDAISDPDMRRRVHRISSPSRTGATAAPSYDRGKISPDCATSPRCFRSE